MKQFKIYTAGKMAGLDPYDQMEWRKHIELSVRHVAEFNGIPCANIRFVHPPMYYQYGKECFQTEKEVKNWDLNQVRTSDIVIVDLDTIETSIGTHYELGIVDAVNTFGDKHIFVIGVGGEGKELHPWIEDTLHRREADYNDAAEYIVNYLLV